MGKDADQDKILKQFVDEKRGIITSNVKYRLISTIAALLTFVVLTFFFGQVTKLTTNIVFQIIALMYLSLFFYFPFKYFFGNFSQISTEYSLNRTIFRTREEIQKVDKMSAQDRDLNSIQTSVIFLRRSLMNYLKFSKKLSPVIYNYELNRLIIGIDKFFNVSSLVLLKDSSCSFSRMQDIEKMEEERREYSENKPSKQEIEAHFEQLSREDQGVFNVFDFEIFDEFLRYLSNTLFYRTKPYSIVYSSHPINLIRISDFFDHWNNRLLECNNCKEIIVEVSKDIDTHHQRIEKEEREHKERMTDLKFSILTIFISVTLSAVVAAIIHG